MSDIHGESELRGQLTSAQKLLEEISFRCIRSSYPDAGYLITKATSLLQEAKCRLVLVAAEPAKAGSQ